MRHDRSTRSRRADDGQGRPQQMTGLCTLLRRLGRDQRGAIAAIFAVLVPVLVGIVGFGVETGIWYTVTIFTGYLAVFRRKRPLCQHHVNKGAARFRRPSSAGEPWHCRLFRRNQRRAHGRQRPGCGGSRSPSAHPIQFPISVVRHCGRTPARQLATAAKFCASSSPRKLIRWRRRAASTSEATKVESGRTWPGKSTH